MNEISNKELMKKNCPKCSEVMTYNVPWNQWCEACQMHHFFVELTPKNRKEKKDNQQMELFT